MNWVQGNETRDVLDILRESPWRGVFPDRKNSTTLGQTFGTL